MGYFNPIAYFIKSFIRIFTKKFFWIIFLCLGMFVCYLLFNNGVFAESNIVFDDTYFSESDIARARQIVGEDIWNNEDYDIILFLQGGWGGSNVNDSKGVFWANIDKNIDINYTVSDTISVQTYGNVSYYTRDNTIIGSSNYNISNRHTHALYNSVGVDFSDRTDVNNITSNCWITDFNSNCLNPKIKVIRSHFNFIDSSNNVIYAATNPIVVNPYFITTDTQLQTFDFDYLQINGGTTPYYTEITSGVGGNATLSLKYIYSGVQTNIDLTNYITVDPDNTWSVNIPYNALTNNVIVRNDKEFSYVFTYTPFYGSEYVISKLNLTYTLTTDEENQINEDSEKQVQSDILQEQKDINQSINDSHVDDITSDTLPADNTNDITSDGVNAIFTSIYNAFCTGEAQDIIFPVPFTDKSFTIKPDYVSSMLTSINASFIITLIQAFWWYLISRYIIKDIMDKINKIKSGNIENIETTNIRGDML